MKKFAPGQPTKIIVHCSASSFGTQRLIRKWHTDKPPAGNGWEDIGYHFVITNGSPAAINLYPTTAGPTKLSFLDGQIVSGRPLQYVGAHCRGQNSNSIGICLVGDKEFTPAQFKTLSRCIDGLRAYYNRPLGVHGHCEFDKNKTCPNFDVRHELMNTMRVKMKPVQQQLDELRNRVLELEAK